MIPAFKPLARANIRELLQQPRAPGIREQAVRINSVSSGLAEEDLNVLLVCYSTIYIYIYIGN